MLEDFDAGGVHFVSDSNLYLSVMTPVQNSKNAAANVWGSSFQAIYSEIQKANTLIQVKNKKMFGKLMFVPPNKQPFSNTLYLNSLFKKQHIAVPCSHYYYLQVNILNRDPSFVGFFDSRIKCLRERVEQFFNQL